MIENLWLSKFVGLGKAANLSPSKCALRLAVPNQCSENLPASLDLMNGDDSYCHSGLGPEPLKRSTEDW